MEEFNIFLQTTFPIFFLIGIGIISRKIGVLKEGDERVLSAYLYYFALPALIIDNLPEIVFTKDTYIFILLGILPSIIACIVLILIFYFRSKETFYLLALSTIYGNTAFYGLPFITYAFPTKQAEFLATLTISSVSIVIFIISILLLELYKLESHKQESFKLETIDKISGFKITIKRILINPMIFSVIIGTLLLVIGVKIPFFLGRPLNLIGNTTSTISLFMLGVLMYGKTITNIRKAFELSLLRMIFLPVLSIIILTLFNIPSLESSIVVLMNSMPLGISMTVLSDQYNFYKETMLTLLLISSIMAGIYLNLWLIIVEKIF